MRGGVRLLRAAAAALALSAGAAVAEGPETAPFPPTRPVVEAETARLASLAPSGRSGWLAVDLGTGKVISAARAGERFVPASVTKLVTAVYALDRLGPAHRFETRLRAAGPVSDGVLEGDLVLEGGGDPELDSDALADLAAKAAEAGLSRVTGRVIVDGSALDTLEAIDPRQPFDAAYNPGVSGLNLNFNRVRFRWTGPTAPLAVTALGDRVDAPVGRVEVRADADTATAARLTIRDGREVWRFHPAALRGRGARWLPVRRPDLYAGDVMRTLARRSGIEVEGPVVAGRAERPADEVARVTGRALPGVLRDMLDFSTNLTAEVVGLAASAERRPGPISLRVSAGRMNAWALARLPGGARETRDFAFANHSGLTLESRVSPARLVAFLRAAADMAPPPDEAHPRLPGAAAALLPPYNVAAEDSGIDFERLDIRAKTGTMEYVRGLAGYAVTPGGRQFAFAIFSNELEARGVRPRALDRRWLAEARAFERALLRTWVREVDADAG